MEELLIEAYGPEGSAILIEAITDSRNRTISEIKKILSDHNAKFGEQGSVKWAFESLNSDDGIIWQVKFKQEISKEAKQKLQELIEELEECDDIQKIYTNT